MIVTKTPDGAEFVVGITHDNLYTIFPVTVENGSSLDYPRRLWYGTGQQLLIDSADFPALAASGLHSETELDQTVSITGLAVKDISRVGRPGQYSGAGFMAEDEDIVSVLKGDNGLVQRLGFTHPQLARPLFHVFNVIQTVMKDSVNTKRGDMQSILYNGRTVYIKFWGAKGWQESIFNDEILGYWQIETWCDLDSDEHDLIKSICNDSPGANQSRLIRQLSFIHTGEMVPFYIMRYGFYEGHTDYRSDPIAISSVFGLRTIEELVAIFGEDLPAVFSRHYSGEMARDQVRRLSRRRRRIVISLTTRFTICFISSVRFSPASNEYPPALSR